MTTKRYTMKQESDRPWADPELYSKVSKPYENEHLDAISYQGVLEEFDVEHGKLIPFIRKLQQRNTRAQNLRRELRRLNRKLQSANELLALYRRGDSYNSQEVHHRNNELQRKLAEAEKRIEVLLAERRVAAE